MLKQAVTSGQISLGKKYARQMFEVVTLPNGYFELRPMTVSPAGQIPEAIEMRDTANGWSPPSGYGTCSQWALENCEALEAQAH